ncbi:MAG TPA: hypothetical protein GXX72_01950 [Clostridiaceae bacterium]|nr:hypothetical protein [Clostridiaceae bacterium]
MSDRVALTVVARFDGGKIRPLQVIDGEGRRFTIDKILDVRRAASKFGGSAIRYTCRIAARRIPIYFDEWHNVWWCEGS